MVDSESFTVSSVEIKLKGTKQSHEQNLARAIKKQELLVDILQYQNAKYPIRAQVIESHETVNL